MTAAGSTQPVAYPMPRPDHDDSRVSVGLLVDVAAALTRHGYPPIRTSPDAAHWQQTLFHTIYQDKP